jgi:hypothetical protein
MVKKLPQSNYWTMDEINRIHFVSIYSWIYRIQLILIIYLLNLVNALIFDSLTKFPLGWILAAIISLIIEKSKDIFHTYVGLSIGRSLSSIDYYNILYYSWHTVIFVTAIVCGIFLVWIILINYN